MKIFCFLALLILIFSGNFINLNAQNGAAFLKSDPCPDHDEIRKVVEKETTVEKVERKAKVVKQIKPVKKKVQKKAKPKVKKAKPADTKCKPNALYVRPGNSDIPVIAADGIGPVEQWEALETPQQIIDEKAKKDKAKSREAKVAAEHDQEFAEIKDNNSTDIKIAAKVNPPKWPKAKKENQKS